jgi:hypothetical protein
VYINPSSVGGVGGGGGSGGGGPGWRTSGVPYYSVFQC